jgi:HemY protein
VRFGFWALLALTLGAFAAHFLLQDRGYVLLNFRGYVVEMSVPGLVLVLTALYLAIRGVVALVRAPRRLGAALNERRMRRSGGELTRGLIHLTEGDWARGERLLTQSLKGSDAPLVHYLLAARAAQQQGARERRDEWLKLAYQESPDAEAAVLLTQAELQLDAGELDAALATLQQLEQARPEHPGALALLARTYQARGEGAQLVALLPRLGRARLTPELREALALQALQSELSRPELTKERLAEVWTQLTSELKAAPALAAQRALALDRLGAGDEAERELRSALKRTWHPKLVEAYGKVRGPDPAKQLKQAETWLKSYPEDAALLISAARLCVANELWGKARSYLESSLALAPVADAYALYGRLLTQLGEDEQALLAFRSGLGLVSPAVAEPLPPARGLAAPEPERKAGR